MVALRNQGLLSTHELKVSVPDRPDWDNANDQEARLLYATNEDLIEGLDYEIGRLKDQSHALNDVSDGREIAVAVFLQGDESFDHAQSGFIKQTPVSYGLFEAEKKNLECVIANSVDSL